MKQRTLNNWLRLLLTMWPTFVLIADWQAGEHLPGWSMPLLLAATQLVLWANYYRHMDMEKRYRTLRTDYNFALAKQGVLQRRHDLLLANLTYAYEDYRPYLASIDSDPTGPGWLTPVVAFDLPVGRVLIPFDADSTALFDGLPTSTNTESMADYNLTNHRLEAMRYN